MTDNEIIKALESLLDKMRAYESEQASIGKGLVKDIISMYSRQKAEIERLTEAGKEAVSCFTRMETLYKIKCKELEVAKAEARKEFAERLIDIAVGNWEHKVDVATIDNLLKEMAGEDNA